MRWEESSERLMQLTELQINCNPQENSSGMTADSSVKTSVQQPQKVKKAKEVTVHNEKEKT